MTDFELEERLKLCTAIIDEAKEIVEESPKQYRFKPVKATYGPHRKEEPAIQKKQVAEAMIELYGEITKDAKNYTARDTAVVNRVFRLLAARLKVDL